MALALENNTGRCLKTASLLGVEHGDFHIISPFSTLPWFSPVNMNVFIQKAIDILCWLLEGSQKFVQSSHLIHSETGAQRSFTQCQSGLACGKRVEAVPASLSNTFSSTLPLIPPKDMKCLQRPQA